MAGTFAGSTAQVDVNGRDKVPEVFRWNFQTFSSQSGTIPFTVNYTADDSLPVQFEQVDIQSMAMFSPTPLSSGFQDWRQECLNRATRVIQQAYVSAVNAYGTNVPTFRDSGSNWSTQASENWMSFIETYVPRLRHVSNLTNITPGRQYGVDSATTTYNGTVYSQGQKFYGTNTATVISSGSVHQIGAFKKSLPGHIGKPALIPYGLYFDGTVMAPKAYYDTPFSTPVVVTCQPWMIESGFYVAQPEFWMPESLGMTLQ